MTIWGIFHHFSVVSYAVVTYISPLEDCTLLNTQTYNCMETMAVLKKVE